MMPSDPALLDNFRTIGMDFDDDSSIARLLYDRSCNKQGHLDILMFKKTLRTAGLYLNDPRLTELNMNVICCQNFIIEHAEESAHPEYHFIDFECFKATVDEHVFTYRII